MFGTQAQGCSEILEPAGLQKLTHSGGAGVDLLRFLIKTKGETMKFVIQRVLESAVEIDGKETSRIGKGFLVLVGVAEGDTKEMADKYVRKLVNMRIFEDEQGKTNLALADVEGELLMVSQFTLHADCKKGNRPGFTRAGNPVKAEELYEYIVDQCRQVVPVVKTGEFGADMKISLINDGPFTVILDEDALTH